ncbi:MAG: EamA family transporter RarD [Planctomycetes bacterium]|nr:EamA family transporter RarD [Planctomycetota bacterium]
MSRSTSSAGLIFALAAYGLWGLIPLYFKALAGIAPFEVLAYRVVWSFAVLAVVMTALGQWREIKPLATNRRTLVLLLLSTLFIGVNWLTFIYAVDRGQVLQSSLGYFATPLANVLLGVVFLGERLRGVQWACFTLAAAALVAPIWLVGAVPWIAITLAVSFSLYGLMKKLAPVGGLPGLTVETLALTPAGLAYLAWLPAESTTANGTGEHALLALSGVVTSVPLLFFAGAAKRLEMKTLSVVQYLAPSVQMLLAVFAFGEPVSLARITSFLMIWAAIAVYLLDSYLVRRRRPEWLPATESEVTLPVEETV